MVPCVVSSHNPSLQIVQATAPKHWLRANWHDFPPYLPLVALCEEQTFKYLPPYAVAIVFDSVRYPKGFLQSLPNKNIITLDAPQPGCKFMWTPVDATLFHPKPWSERKEVICPIRSSNYLKRSASIEQLQKMGVRIIERDDTRPYQDYVNDLCSARAVINFCADRKTGKPQVKGRVFETLAAGAVLLEEFNQNTLDRLPMYTYFGWAEVYELRSLLEWVSSDASRFVAKTGRKAATDLFNAERFWNYVDSLLMTRHSATRPILGKGVATAWQA